MATLNRIRKELVCKVVYYGPGLGGKTTNLKQIHAMLDDDVRGEMTCLATREDRTLFFDLLPVDLGRIGDYHVKIQLYTVPGQSFYDATRRVMLNGVDGIVMVFDSDPERQDANYVSLGNLEENLASYGRSLDDVSILYQFNKRDLGDAMELDAMSAALNPDAKYPEISATAIEGIGVMETVQQISSMVFERFRAKLPKTQSSDTASQSRPRRRVPRKRDRPTQAEREAAAAAISAEVAAAAEAAISAEAALSGEAALEAAPKSEPNAEPKFESKTISETVSNAEPSVRAEPVIGGGVTAVAPAGVGSRSAVWLRQVCDLRIAGMRIGHAIIELKGQDSEDHEAREGGSDSDTPDHGTIGPEFRATIELRPIIGPGSIRKASFWKSTDADAEPGACKVYETRGPGSDAGVRLGLDDSEGSGTQIYLDWRTRLGRLQILPEGRGAMPL